MNVRITDYAYIFVTVGLTVYGQLILKWRIGVHGALPGEVFAKVKFLALLLLDPFIFSGFVAAFGAALAWMVAISRFELSYAYPFMALNFVLVLLLSVWLFKEPVSGTRALGVTLIVFGTLISAIR